MKKERKFISEFYKHNKMNLFMALLASVIIALLNLFVSYLLQEIIDIAIKKEMAELLKMVYFTLGLLGVMVLSFILRGYFEPIFIHKAMAQYKSYAINKLFNSSITSFNKATTTDYISCLTNDAAVIEENYISIIFQIITNVIMFIGAIIIMFINNYILASVGIGLSLIPFFITILFGRKLEKKETLVSTSNASFMHRLKDYLTGFVTIKSFTSEAKFERLLKDSNNNLENSKRKRDFVKTNVEMLAATTSVIAELGVFVMGAFLAIKYDSISAGEIILFVQLMNFIVNPIAVIPECLAKRNACKPLIIKLNNLVNDISDDSTAKIVFNRTLELNNINLELDDNKILTDINLKLEMGKAYAIVGPSGAGKSSLLSIIMGKNKYEGEVEYDGIQVKKYDPSSIYEIMSLVEQNVFIFDATIRDNITMYNESYKDKDLDDVLKRSGLDELVKEKTLDYDCGDTGSKLSGGEKQRLSIARALIRKSKLLLIDEATSALDNNTSASIANTILDLTDTTRLVITHRLEGEILKRYDSIIVMKDGRIIENDTFDNLMSKDSFFKSMYNVCR